MIFGLSIGLDFIVLGHRLFDAGLGSEYADILDKLRDGDPSPFVKFMGKLLLSCAAFFVIGIILSKSININRISLHTLYRNRLIRAFLGASSLARKPNLFTDFDTSDDLQMHDLRPEKSPIERTCWRPFLVLNLTLNMVSAKRLAWQERKAASFTVSPLHCGTGSKTYQTHPEAGHTVDRPVGAYRYSAKYGHPRHGLSLGTAMAISGVAANPNMGYHSSPAITFIMTMLNLRLGWWLGNPAKEGQRTYNHEGPQNAIVPLFQETFGLTTDSKEYVHLSDGGHFDNLGLYEMVRRRCRFILVCDAGRDPTFGFEDLGNAVRKIFIDLGIPIRFNNLQTLKPRGREVDNSFAPKRAYHVIGEIDYQSIDPEGGTENGFILYIKPSYHGSESAAIRSYAMANQEFPHQTTANQWFTESQFEAYRSLGFEIMDEILMTSLKEPGSSAPRWKDICTQLKRAGVQQ
jgi:hypothetical protein